MHSRFGTLRDPESSTPNEPIVIVAMDDLKVSSATFPDHIRQVKILLNKAREIGAEFKTEKCSMADDKAVYWGFLLDSEGRRPTEDKLEQLKNWPDYQSLDDLKSHVHFSQYLKEFLPELPSAIAPL